MHEVGIQAIVIIVAAVVLFFLLGIAILVIIESLSSLITRPNCRVALPITLLA
jgi:hypothetical protein